MSDQRIPGPAQESSKCPQALAGTLSLSLVSYYLLSVFLQRAG